jgi:hypothetical protein
LHVRQHAAASLHCPTAVDGWGNLFFVPRAPQPDKWPRHGSATATPIDDKPSLPEAVHGPARVSRESVDVYPLAGEIAVGDRVAEFGENAMRRAIARLQQAVAP